MSWTPFAVSSGGRLVSVDEVNRGLKCECTCPQCNSAMVACHGEIVSHYFRHHAERLCDGSFETSIHMFAKQVIVDELILSTPHNLGPIKSAVAEPWLEALKVRPDVLLQYESEPVAVEVFVTHRVPMEKLEKYAAVDHTVIEIDLSAYQYADKSETDWAAAVLNEAPRVWLIPPKVERARLEGLKAERVKAALKAQTHAFQIAERLETRREEYEEQLRDFEARNAKSDVISMKRRELQEAADFQRRAAAAAFAAQRAHDRETEIKITKSFLFSHESKLVPAPCLQALVSVHGTYGKIPEQAWGAYRRSMELYREALREGRAYNSRTVKPRGTG